MILRVSSKRASQEEHPQNKLEKVVFQKQGGRNTVILIMGTPNKVPQILGNLQNLSVANRCPRLLRSIDFWIRSAALVPTIQLVI